jgi:hypothetical protein
MKKLAFTLLFYFVLGTLVQAQDKQGEAQKSSKKMLKIYVKGNFPKNFSEDSVFDDLSNAYTKILEAMGGDLSSTMLSYDAKDKELTIMLIVKYPNGFSMKEFSEKANLQTREVIKSKKIAVKEVDIQL